MDSKAAHLPAAAPPPSLARQSRPERPSCALRQRKSRSLLSPIAGFCPVGVFTVCFVIWLLIITPSEELLFSPTISSFRRKASENFISSIFLLIISFQTPVWRKFFSTPLDKPYKRLKLSINGQFRYQRSEFLIPQLLFKLYMKSKACQARR